MSNRPLADILRPDDFDDMVGQEHLFGKDGVIRKSVENGRVTNMIFHGPPGIGKTTAANIIAKKSGMTIKHLNATTASIADIRQVIAETGSLFGMGGILLYLDEIQYFNKKQQQSLLEFIEDGRITLIASTTENPYIYVYNAILSRSGVYEFYPVGSEKLRPVLERGMAYLCKESGSEKALNDRACEYISSAAAGDVRRALNILESVFYSSDGEITEEEAKKVISSSIGNFDKSGTVHYDLLSALQKSIRGSDPDAAIFYLAKILSGGDLIGACRRLQVIASEDIGAAYPLAAVITRSCVESAFDVGMPEAAIPLSNAAIMLATAPKSNSAYIAYAAALEDATSGKGQSVPPHMRPSHQFDGYLYPHSYPDHYVKQQYLPDDLKNKKYYSFGENKTEQAAKTYWDGIKNKKESQ